MKGPIQIRLQLTPAQALRSLFWLRGCAVIVQVAVIIAAFYVLGLPLPLRPLLLIVGGLASWNLLALWRLRQPWSVSQAEVVIHLAADTLALTGLLYWTGGPSNPFVSFYMVPIAIAAAILGRMHAWTVAALCMTAYSLLIWNYAAVSDVHDMHHDFRLHVFGMWITFMLCAVLIGVFITTMAAAVRRREQSLAETREKTLRDEHIVALGTMAAGAAHELSTPLSTMAVIAGELRDQYGKDAALLADLNLLSEQIGICRQQLDLLLDAAGRGRSAAASTAPLREFLEGIFDRWRLMRPTASAKITFDTPFDNPVILTEPTLAQSLLSALNNAADAGLESGRPGIDVRLSSDGHLLTIEILDEGPGLNEAQRAQAGRVLFTTKAKGFGLGLVLSHASVERLGGEISLEPRAGGGTRTRLTLPLTGLILQNT